MRARQPPERRRQALRAAAGGRSPGSQLLIHVPIGYAKLFRENPSTGCTRPSLSRAERPAGVPAARKSARRLQLDQRPAGSCAASTRIVTLAPARQCRLGLRRRAALFQEGGEPAARPRQYHGAGGPLPVSDWRHHDPLSEAFVSAAAETGIPTQSRFQRRHAGGRGLLPDHDNATAGALSTALSCLRPAKCRSNLHVETSALAQRILFDGRRAQSAVEYKQEGTRAHGAGAQGNPGVERRV